MTDVFLVSNVTLYFEWRDGRGGSVENSFFKSHYAVWGLGIEEEVSKQVRYFYCLSSWPLFSWENVTFSYEMDMRGLWSSVQGVYIGNKAIWRQIFLTSQSRGSQGGQGNTSLRSLPGTEWRERQAGLPYSGLLCSILSAHMDWFEPLISPWTRYWGNKSIPKVAHSLLEIIELSSHLPTGAKTKPRQDRGQGSLTMAASGS